MHYPPGSPERADAISRAIGPRREGMIPLDDISPFPSASEHVVAMLAYAVNGLKDYLKKLGDATEDLRHRWEEIKDRAFDAVAESYWMSADFIQDAPVGEFWKLAFEAAEVYDWYVVNPLIDWELSVDQRAFLDHLVGMIGDRITEVEGDPEWVHLVNAYRRMKVI